VKLLFDRNLSYRWVPALKSLYPGSMHIRDAGLTMADDEAVWIRLGNCTTAHIDALLRTRQTDLLAFDHDANASFLALAYRLVAHAA
jgi:predicted nuclease of predicted toxin-antitoxin system